MLSFALAIQYTSVMKIQTDTDYRQAGLSSCEPWSASAALFMFAAISKSTGFCSVDTVYRSSRFCSAERCQTPQNYRMPKRACLWDFVTLTQPVDVMQGLEIKFAIRLHLCLQFVEVVSRGSREKQRQRSMSEGQQLKQRRFRSPRSARPPALLCLPEGVVSPWSSSLLERNTSY